MALITALFAGIANVGRGADDAKKPAASDQKPADAQQGLSDLAGAPNGAQDDAGANDAAKKKPAAKNNKKANAARQKKLEKAAQLKKARQDRDAAEAQQMQQMPQQQMPQNMMMGPGGRGGYGSNTRNRSMFLLMQQFDANGNGQLDPQELQAMKLAMAQVQAGGSNVAVAQYLRQFDTNGDGQLSPQEMQAAQAAMTRGMVGGQVGPGGLPLPNGQVLPKVR